MLVESEPPQAAIRKTIPINIKARVGSLNRDVSARFGSVSIYPIISVLPISLPGSCLPPSEAASMRIADKYCLSVDNFYELGLPMDLN